MKKTVINLIFCGLSSLCALNVWAGPVRSMDQKILYSPIATAPGIATGRAPVTLQHYLENIHAYNTDHLKIEKSTLPGPQCGMSYFVEFKVSGFWNDIQSEVHFYTQTLTAEAQDRLYRAIKNNYAKRGLPRCLLQDSFMTLQDGIIAFHYHYNPDRTSVLVPASLKEIPAGFDCSDFAARPYTSCWNMADPYSE